MSKNLQKLTPEARQAFLSQNKNIAPFFNEDGTVREFAAQDNVAQNSPIENVNTTGKNSQTFGNINEEAYSRSLQGRETELAYAPVSAEAMPTETAKRVMKNVTLNSQGKKMFYDIVNINESDLLTNGSKPEISAKSLSTNSIRSKIENVNPKRKKS
ncbi:MAG: hypothetical protein IJX30_00495 [Clostridia bacterium]|nr:hypothetical protein [Clostridia bacterium]